MNEKGSFSKREIFPFDYNIDYKFKHVFCFLSFTNIFIIVAIKERISHMWLFSHEM